MKISRWPILYSNGGYKIFLWSFLDVNKDAKEQHVTEIINKRFQFVHGGNMPGVRVA
jgi:hypothetical protein